MSLDYTTSYGSTVNYPHAAQRVSTNGPLLIQDFHTIDNLAHLARERIPERLVHAKGAGAYGYFEVTDDLSDITSQTLFHIPDGQAGAKVDATVRFSTVAGELGSADTARDVHGFAIKLKTDQGNLDWVLLDTPIFFIRDPGKYPDLVHATKKNPQTNLKDPVIFWDFFSQNPETVHMILMLFSDRGTPDGYDQTHGFSGTTFKFVKKTNVSPTSTNFVYFKLHVRTEEFKTLTAAEATRLAGEDPDYGTRKLYEAIDSGKYPEYTVHIQTMDPGFLDPSYPNYEYYRRIAFDVTKIWPFNEFPLRPVGKLVLNRNPLNYFDEIEQLAYAPAHLIPYVETVPDPLLQSRLFTYPDTQRYRLGVNNQQLPCNAPIVKVANYQRAGAGSYVSQGNRPNYESSYNSLCFAGPVEAIDSQINDNNRQEHFDGTVDRQLTIPDSFDFVQPRALWVLWTEPEKETFVQNVSDSIALIKITISDIILQDKYWRIIIRQIYVFLEVSWDLAWRVFIAVLEKEKIIPWIELPREVPWIDLLIDIFKRIPDPLIRKKLLSELPEDLADRVRRALQRSQ